MFCKIGALKNFAKFTGKHLCKSLSFIKVAGLRPATLLKKRLWHRCFPVSFAKFLTAPFLTEYLRWMLPAVSNKHKVRITCILFLSSDNISNIFQLILRSPIDTCIKFFMSTWALLI